MPTHTNCPKCNKPGCEVLQDEVDIGVGTQVHVFGYECVDCGQIAVCNSCGQPDFLPHTKWCKENGQPIV